MNTKLTSLVIHKDNCWDKPFDQIYSEHVQQEAIGDLIQHDVTYVAKPILGGISIEYNCEFNELHSEFGIKHLFFFPNWLEMREMSFLISEKNNVSNSVLNIYLPKGAQNYMNVAVVTSDNYLIRSDVLIFNSDGKVTPFPHSNSLLSEWSISNMSLKILDKGEDHQSLEFILECNDGYYENPQIFFSLQTNGIIIEEKIHIPDSGQLRAEIPLDKKKMVSGYWLVAISDANRKMLGQVMLYLG